MKVKTNTQRCTVCKGPVRLNEDGVLVHFDKKGNFQLAGYRIVNNDGSVREDHTHFASLAR